MTKPRQILIEGEFGQTVALRVRPYALLLIIVLHTWVLYSLYLSPANSEIKVQANTIMLQFFSVISDDPKKTAIKKSADAKTLGSSQPQLAKVKPELSPSVAIAEPTTSIEQTKEELPAESPPQTASEKYRSMAGKTWKEVEAEKPLRKWLNSKKQLSVMENFAIKILESSTAREVTTKEEIRADGSRMTRVTTPHGEFCVVVAPMPGRSFEMQGPEKRVMHCPVYVDF
jgi:hypothetical protein